MVFRNVETNEVRAFGPGEITQGLELLAVADEIIGHNVIAYDFPAVLKLYPDFTTTAKITDTLVLSRLIKANIMQDDAEGEFRTGFINFPKRLWGSHSLQAWGLRVGNLKGDYTGGWEEFSQEMFDYCIQDTNVTLTIYKKFMAAGFSQESIDLEHSLAEICFRIGNNGWTFDQVAAAKLYGELAQRRSELTEELNELFPPWDVEEEFIPKANNKTRGYVKGEVFIKRKVITFNPGSRQHIQKCLVEKYGWKPKEFTNNGQAKIDDEILGTLDYPEAKRLSELFLINKRIGMLAEGSHAWLKKVDAYDGRIRHTIVSGGTVSGRAAHRGPNLTQVPSAGSPYGKECRSLFGVPKGWTLCGSDLSGLELRCLAHYLDDGGEYASQVLDGDIHTYNQKAAGLATRNQAKTFIYATMYGGGASLIGQIAGGGAPEGAKLKKAFETSIPAFGKLRSNIEKAVDRRGYLKGLDGRHLYLRSAHKGLSQLLQSAGAVLCKRWVELIDQEITKQHKGDAYIVGWIHDEVQIACRTEEIANDVGNIAGRMAEQSGASFQTKIPIAAEYQLGRTWADTH